MNKQNNASIIKILEQHIHCNEVEREVFEAVLPVVEAWGGKQINKRLATAIDTELLRVFGDVKHDYNGGGSYPKCTAHIEKKQWGDGYELKLYWQGSDRYISSSDEWSNWEAQYSRKIEIYIWFDNQTQLVENIKNRIQALKDESVRKATIIGNLEKVQNFIAQYRELRKQAEELTGYDLKMIEDFTRD